MNGQTDINFSPTLGPVPNCQPPQALAPSRLAYHSIGLDKSFSLHESRLYSRMKYGDPVATRSIAKRMVKRLVKSGALRALLKDGDSLCLAASAYGEIPTAARTVTEEMASLLAEQVPKVHLLRFVRQGGFGGADYGKMNFMQRRAAMAKRRIELEAGCAEILEGKPLLVFDDLRSTGLHEAALHDSLLQSELPTNTLFAYWIAFAPDLANANPAQEERLNAAAIGSFEDLARMFSRMEELPHTNARLVKFILGGGKDAREDVGAFLSSISPEIVFNIHRAARSKDGYFRHKRFQKGYLALESRLQPQLT